MGLLSWLERATEVRKVQKALTDAFAQRGINYMRMHPAVHKALLQEAMKFKRIDRTVEMYLEVVQAGYDQGLDDLGVADHVRSVYEMRMQLYS